MGARERVHGVSGAEFSRPQGGRGPGSLVSAPVLCMGVPGWRIFQASSLGGGRDRGRNSIGIVAARMSADYCLFLSET